MSTCLTYQISVQVPGLKVELADLPLTEFTVSFLIAQLIKSQLETKRKMRKEEEFARKQAAAAEKVADMGVDEVLNLSDDEGDGTVDAAWLISDDSDEEEYTESKKKAEKLVSYTNPWFVLIVLLVQ